MNLTHLTARFCELRAAMSRSDWVYVAILFGAAVYFIAAWTTGNRQGDLILQAILCLINIGLWCGGAMMHFWFRQVSKLANENLALYEREVAKWKRVNSEIAEAIVECEHFNEAARIATARTCGRILHAMEEPEDD